MRPEIAKLKKELNDLKEAYRTFDVQKEAEKILGDTMKRARDMAERKRGYMRIQIAELEEKLEKAMKS